MSKKSWTWTVAPIAGMAGFGIVLWLVISSAGSSPDTTNWTWAIGEVRSAERTSLQYEEKPQVAFTVHYYTEDGQETTVMFKQLMTPEDLARYPVGTVVPIKYNPARPDKDAQIMLNPDPAEVDKAYDRYYLATGQMTQEEFDIKQNGVQAQAVIVSASPTGEIVAKNRTEMSIQVTVNRPDGTTYQVTTTAALAQSDIPYAIAGSIVSVYYLPEDEQNIFIVFHR